VAIRDCRENLTALSRYRVSDPLHACAVARVCVRVRVRVQQYTGIPRAKIPISDCLCSRGLLPFPDMDNKIIQIIIIIKKSLI
jgi:hypothetical protein